ncbi:putative NBD/HSP70 family sugar kinase [Aequitasia blattaphilus]|uniref:ROK family protein n=1 Tax=Aequitasia blattaphilus TaxID=2949332 RepID=A0ABT1ED11_9FIRM|nr:ROK family protein [Aequitasia blattaphilus]MCP1103720.1 ROK family protein [Aequitasia blattaphilus]MCR8616360.1 ROK family protein [Aequitasia blattaphilus]
MLVNNNHLNERLTRKSQQIYHFIRKHGSVSKQDIVIGLKLSLPTVTQNLQYLTDMELVDTSKKILNTGGRNATAYTYIRSTRMAIGVYLTSNHISVVAVDLSGNVVDMEKVQIKFDLADEDYLKRIGELVELVKVRTDIKDESLLGVGIAVQSLVSSDGETIRYGIALDFAKTTRKEIAKYIPYKNRLFHDPEMACYAEVWIDRSIQNAFYISLSNSVGGAVVVDNNIYRGNSLKGGEIGHMLAVRENGEKCYCGKYGCFDTVCRATKLDEYTNGNLDAFFVKLRSGDKIAQEKWDAYLYELSLAIHNIRMLFDGKVILGGYVGAYIGDYIDQLCELVDARTPFEDDKAKDYLMPCKYKVEATAAGAAMNYIDDFFDEI